MRIYSHSKINLLLEDLYSYFLNYEYKISPIKQSAALLTGSALHHALEHETSNLNDYFKSNGSFTQSNSYSNEQILAEVMAEQFLKHKQEILKEILGNSRLLDSYKELRLEVSVNEHIKFLGIIDLLLITNNGFIVIDYKTVSRTPDYNTYLDQLYRYCYLLKKTFPDTPINKIAIISLRKSSLKRKNNENEDTFRRRIVRDYQENIDNYISYHVFDYEKDYHIFNDEILNNYYSNLTTLINTVDEIQSNVKHIPVNYSKAHNIYGRSQYYDFIYFDENLIKAGYVVRDKYYDEISETVISKRNISDFDLEIIKTKNTDILKRSIIHYDKFLEVINSDLSNLDNIKDYLYDQELINNYIKVFKKEHNLL